MVKEKTKNSPIIGISVGDLNGIGMEVILKTLESNKLLQYFTPIIYGSGKSVIFYKKNLKLDKFNFQQIKHIGEVKHKAVNVINCWEEHFEIQPGLSSKEAGKYALLSLKAATKDLQAGKIDAIVTAPINKDNIQSEEFKFPGHTEFLANAFNTSNQLMMMVSGGMRVGVATGHVPLKDVSQQLTAEKIISNVKALDKTLKEDFNIQRPLIAVLGFNPHAGEEGLLGKEEQEVIAPAIEYCKENGILAHGPFPSDGFFGKQLQNKFDGVLAMYHDQGLGPFKALAFETGVNFTAGLPVIRTSPDHGTAYDIAGKGEADPSSFREAVYLAIDVYKAHLNSTEKREA